MTKKRLHIKQAIELMEMGGNFSLRVWKQNGEIVSYRNCELMIHHHKTGVLRVRLHPSGQIRQFKEEVVLEINEMEVYL